MNYEAILHKVRLCSTILKIKSLLFPEWGDSPKYVETQCSKSAQWGLRAPPVEQRCLWQDQPHHALLCDWAIPALLFSPGKSHGQRNLGTFSPWDHKVAHDWATNTNSIPQFCHMKNDNENKACHLGLLSWLNESMYTEYCLMHTICYVSILSNSIKIATYTWVVNT